MITAGLVRLDVAEREEGVGGGENRIAIKEPLIKERCFSCGADGKGDVLVGDNGAGLGVRSDDGRGSRDEIDAGRRNSSLPINGIVAVSSGDQALEGGPAPI